MSEAVHASEAIAAQNCGPLDINQIQALLRHRYPFLLLDRILELQRMKRVVGLKNVTINEPFFNGHFPGAPIMPGVLLVETMAQCGAVLLLTEIQDREDKLVFFTGIERARFRRPVVPGDQLRIEVDVLVWRRITGRMDGKVFVDGKLVAEAIISCALVDRSRNKLASQNQNADGRPGDQPDSPE
jgi:3-hydroxyacyl-[acyl-carrier-protein] dehydratase